MSKLSDDFDNDCCIISRSGYSIFFWDDNTHHKFVPHQIHMKIPLMTIDEERKHVEENVNALFTQIPSFSRFTNANFHTGSPKTAQQPVDNDVFVSTTPIILLSNKPTSEDAKPLSFTRLPTQLYTSARNTPTCTKRILTTSIIKSIQNVPVHGL